MPELFADAKQKELELLSITGNIDRKRTNSTIRSLKVKLFDVLLTPFEFFSTLTITRIMSGLLSSQLINGVYIPSALLIAGVGIAKAEWLPYAVAISLLLGGLRVFTICTSKIVKSTNCFLLTILMFAGA